MLMSSINPFYQTDYSVLTEDDLIEAIKRQDYYLSYFFHKAHVQNEKNRNIYLKTKKSKQIYYLRENNEWDTMSTEQAMVSITQLCDNAFDDRLIEFGLFKKFDRIIGQYVYKREENEEYKQHIYSKFKDILYTNEG